MALTQTSTNGIKDATIATADIADDAVTLAKMAAGTDGQIITYDASGNPTVVGPGTDGQVLTSTGAGSPPAFETPAAGVGGATGVDFNDDVKARFGTGNDLEIYHNGSHSFINNSTGNLDVQGDSIRFKKLSTEEYMLTCVADGTTKLWYDNSAKLETKSYGADVTGYLQVGIGGGTNGLLGNDDVKIRLGTDQDLEIYHDGTDSHIDNSTGGLVITDTGGYVRIKSNDLKLESSTDEDYIACTANGAVNLYYDNALRAYTSTNGFQVYKASSDDVEFRIVNDQNTTAGATNTILSQHDLRTTAKIVFGRMNDNSDFSAAAGATQGDIQFWTTQSGSNAKRGTFINSGGLCFGTDTAAANALDDYEEGTFSPILRTNGDTTGQVTGSGTYVKIGRAVHIHVLFGNKTLTSLPTGDIAVVSLPFTANHTNGDEFGMSSKCVIMGVDSNSTHGYFRTGNGSAAALGYYNQDGSTWAQWSTTQWDNSGVYLIFNMTYFTNS